MAVQKIKEESEFYLGGFRNIKCFKEHCCLFFYLFICIKNDTVLLFWKLMA